MAQRNSSRSRSRSRSSSRDDGGAPRTPANPNVFDDEYALDPDDVDFAFMPVADGFRPAADMPGRDRQDRQSDFRLKTRDATSPDNRSPRSPSTHHARGPSAHAMAALQRHASVSSTVSYAATTLSEGAYGVGPSHPYAMYTQNTVARTSSVATSSASRPSHQPSFPQPPAHPYGLYAQNVVEDEPPAPPAQSGIPVGFPGLGSGYHRQIGPDGEEQDIIGPDGHAEQLPPYSRYPEGPAHGPTKVALAAAASSSPAAAPVPAFTVLPVASLPSDDALPPVSPIEHTQVFDPLVETGVPPAHAAPTTAQVLPPPQLPPSAHIAAASSSVAVSELPLPFSEKGDMESRKKSWRSKKMFGRLSWGWALLILILFLLLVVIILAAALASKKHSSNGHGPKFGNEGYDSNEPSPQVTGSTGTTLIDASPIATPTSMVSLPTGHFALPLGIAQESSQNCLTDGAQLSAWSCKMTFAPLVLTISDLGAKDSRLLASLQGLPKPDGSIQYGIQPPRLELEPLQLVLDLDNMRVGPAYHFSSRYDKVVVLNQDEFAAGAAVTQKQDKPAFHHRFQVTPGDDPWYCFWNQTYIEAFIYVEGNSSAASFTNFPTAWPNSYSSSVPVETIPPATTVDTATDTVVSFIASSAPSGTPTPPTSPVRRHRRDGDGDYPRHAPYPRVVKIEERRLPDAPQPYCQKMQLLDNGDIVQALDSTNAPIKVYLQENSPSMTEFLKSATPTPDPTPQHPVRRKADVGRRGDPAHACHCQWVFQ